MKGHLRSNCRLRLISHLHPRGHLRLGRRMRLKSHRRLMCHLRVQVLLVVGIERCLRAQCCIRTIQRASRSTRQPGRRVYSRK